MRKPTVIRLLPMLILLTGVFISSGCSNKSCISSFKPKLPAKFIDMKFPFITEGADLICSNGNETGAYINYSGISYRELQDKYEQKLKSEGWEFVREKDYSESLFETTVLRDGKQITLSFFTCGKEDKKWLFFSNCAGFGIKEKD